MKKSHYNIATTLQSKYFGIAFLRLYFFWKLNKHFSLYLIILIFIFIAPACSRVRYRRPIFRPSIRPSVSPSIRLSTFMLTFDIYVKVSILINCKTKQPSNLAWNISLTSWLCDIGVRFSLCLSVRLSTFMLKFDIYVIVSILINYKTKQPSNLAWNISMTSWLCDIGTHFSIRLFVRPSVRLLTVLLCRSSTFMSKLVF